MSELPEGWAETTMGAVAEVVGGGTPSAKDSTNFCREGGHPWLTPADLSGFDGLYVSHGARNLTPKGLKESSAKLMRKGTVLMSSRAPIGYLAIAANGISTNQGFKSFVCPPEIDPAFVLFWLRSIADELKEMGSGSTFAEISGAKAKEIPFRVAPQNEQRRVVTAVEALLGQVARAKGRLDRVPLILKRFRQMVLVAAFSGELTREWREVHPDAITPPIPAPSQEVRRGRRGANLSGDGALLVDDELPELPDMWSYVRVDRLTEPGTVITYGIVLPGPEIECGVPYVRGQDVEDGRLRTDALRHTTKEIASKYGRSSLRRGDVLLCIIRNLRVAIVPEGLDGANITQGMVRIRTSPKLLGRDFLAFYLMSPLAQGWMKRRYFGMDMPRINVEDARAIPVALPSLDEQAEIIRQIQRLFALADVIERRVQAATARAERLPQAILSKAFSGDLVPTEADLARAEGRTYETAEDLLARIKKEQATTGEPAAPKKAGRGRSRGAEVSDAE